jgi:hypothetical protein
MKIRGSLLLVFCIILLSLVLACQQPASKPVQTPATPSQSTAPSTPPASIPPASQPAATKNSWTADGIISPGEYTKTKAYSDYEISWSNDATYVYIGMKAKTPGWVAVGFGAESMMKNADIVMGYVADGKAQVDDDFSTGEFGPHPVDTQLGGTSDIIESAVKVDNGYTTVEFKRKLDTGDKYDKPLVKGTNKIIWAYGSEPKATLKHMARGSGEIDIQ